jgi:transcriptional regulator NrdR family protein
MIDETLTHCTCGKRLRVIDSRARVYGNVQAVWRRRKCYTCNTLSYTIEMPAQLAKRVLNLSSPALPVRKTTAHVR